MESAALAFDDVGEATMARIIQARAHYYLGDIASARELVVCARAELAQRTPDSELNRLLDTVEFSCLIRSGAAAKAAALLSKWPPSGRRTLLAARLTAVRRHRPDRAGAVGALHPQTVRGAASRHLLLAVANRSLNSRLAEAQVAAAERIMSTENGLLMLPLELPELRDVAERVAAHTGGGARDQPAPATGNSEPVELHLSTGEVQLLALLPERMTNAQLAEQLGVSVNTVKTRLQRLYRKLGVRKSYEAVTEARQLGIIPAPAFAADVVSTRTAVPISGPPGS